MKKFEVGDLVHFELTSIYLGIVVKERKNGGFIVKWLDKKTPGLYHFSLYHIDPFSATDLTIISKVKKNG